MNDRQVQRLIERRRQELLARRAKAMAHAIHAVLALRIAAQAVHHADRQLRLEGFHEPPATVDDASAAIYEEPPSRIRAWPGAMEILAEALKQTEITRPRPRRRGEEKPS